MMPMVSQKRSRSAPSALAAAAYSSRKPNSVREASSALTETYMPWLLAKAVASRMEFRTHARSFMSLVSMWMSLVASEMATASTPQSMEVLMSATFARFQPSTDAFRPRCAISVMTSASSPPMTGMPASIWSTPISSSILGDRDLLGIGEHDAGGLLAVAQRRVVELDCALAEIALDRQLPDLRVSPRARTSSYTGVHGTREAARRVRVRGPETSRDPQKRTLIVP